MSGREHWEQVYATKASSAVSWFQVEAEPSLSLIEAAAPDRSSVIVDVGAGASALVDGLLARGYTDLTMLDLSGAALSVSQARLGAVAERVRWVAGDVLTHPFAPGTVDVWHDRAVFHFLTDEADRRAYVEQVRAAVRPGGHVLIGTFAEDGPTKCSGLEVCRYSSESLHHVFGDAFQFVAGFRHAHVTPGGGIQQFQFCHCTVDVMAGAVA